MRILCISPFFAPKADSEAFCGGKLVLELLKQGVDLAVLCLDPASPRLHAACDQSSVWEPLRAITVNIVAPGHRDRMTSARLGFRYRSLTYARWIAEVVGKAECLHRQKPFDLVYSRSLPMEAHVAGYWTSRRLGIPWVANINDPWDWHLMPESMRMQYGTAQRSLSNYWMRKTFTSADMVTYPSSRLMDYHCRLSGMAHRSRVLPHIGYVGDNSLKGPRLFRLVHAGKLGGLEDRSPNAFLKGVSLFLKKCPEAGQSLRVTLVGPQSKQKASAAGEPELAGIIEPAGRVSYERSLEHIQSASVCVLVEGNLSEGIFLPSKLADYIVARKPVLALSPRVGVLADMSMQGGVLRTDTDDASAVATALGVYYHAFKKSCLHQYAPSEALVRRFSPQTVTEDFLEKAREVVDMQKVPAGPGSSSVVAR